MQRAVQQHTEKKKFTLAMLLNVKQLQFDKQ